jgi:hypothetical protein
MSFPDGGYSSHLEALAWAVAKTVGPVVEYGGGWYSTPMLHGACEALGRRLYTYETDEHMLQQLTQGWACDWHRVVDKLGSLPKAPGLVFVDGTSEGRSRALKRSHRAQLVVVHDTEPQSYDSYPGMHDELGKYKYRRDWTVYPWWTTVVSNTMEVGV